MESSHIEPSVSKPAPLVTEAAVLATALVAGGAMYLVQQQRVDALEEEIASIRTHASPPPSTSPSGPASAKVYVNSRVGYSFAYNEDSPTIDVDETIKYDPSATYAPTQKVDTVQFVHAKKAYSVTVYITEERTLDAWLTYADKNIGAIDDGALAKRTMDGKEAAVHTSQAIAYVKSGRLVLEILGREGDGIHSMRPIAVSDAMYQRVLSSLNFTP